MTIQINGGVAFVHSDEVVISDGQSALDFIAAVGFAHHCHKVALNKTAVAEDFFRLRTGVAGEVAQKFVNYGVQLAIYGDFSGYGSPALQEFMRESNRGRHLLFVADETGATEKLLAAHKLP